MAPRTLHRAFDQVPTFDAFISYSSKDRKLVEEVAGRLAAQRFDVFFDSWYIEPGQHIPKMVLAALRKSRNVVACLTPNYFQSKWTEFELNWNFVETHLAPAGANPPVIPVMLRTCEIPKETQALRRIDLTGNDREAGYRELVAVLSRVESLVIQSMIVPAGPESASLGELVVDKLKLFFDFPETRLRHFLSVYGELVHNAFDHVKKKVNRVEVSVNAHAQKIVLEVSDSGAGFDLPGSLRAQRDVVANDPSSVGPRGLHLVSAFCDGLRNEVRNRRHVAIAELCRDRIIAGASLAPRRYANVVVLCPVGRIDHTTTEPFKAALAPYLERCTDSEDRLVLDLSRVDYISSTGLRALMLAQKQAKAQRGMFAVASLQPLVQEIFEISRFTMVIEVFPSVREALSRIAPASLSAWDASGGQAPRDVSG